MRIEPIVDDVYLISLSRTLFSQLKKEEEKTYQKLIPCVLAAVIYVPMATLQSTEDFGKVRYHWGEIRRRKYKAYPNLLGKTPIILFNIWFTPSYVELYQNETVV